MGKKKKAIVTHSKAKKSITPGRAPNVTSKDSVSDRTATDKPDTSITNHDAQKEIVNESQLLNDNENPENTN